MDDSEELIMEDDEEPITDGPFYDKFLRVAKYPGIAFYCFAHDDYDDKVHASMVGDDYRWVFRSNEVSLIEDERDFCHGCGQIGCAHDGLDRR